MDWKLLAATFTAVFFAELGDKTQLATLTLAGESGKTMTVFAGSALALVTSALIAALLGSVLNRYIDPIWIKRVAGIAFVVMGILILFRTGE